MTNKLFALTLTASLAAAAALAAPQRPAYTTESRIGSRSALTAIPGEYNRAQRPIYTLENRLPDQWHLELGLSGGMNNIEENFYVPNTDVYSLAADARFGLIDAMALTLHVPYVSWELDPDDVSESGIGDVCVGAQFRAFEDIFEYPWIIVHGHVALPTGDEDKGLGTGDVTGVAGVSIGTTVEDVWHFIADGSWVMNDNLNDDQDGFVRASVSVLWDLDEACTLMAEGRFIDYATEEDESATFMGHLGLAYDFGNGLSAMVYGGAATGSGNDGYGAAKLVYSF
ncbi:MAG: transporter [Kiritimatiellae bacterium]|nr:transporter [Kiritimatiellia bacterium]